MMRTLEREVPMKPEISKSVVPPIVWPLT